MQYLLSSIIYIRRLKTQPTENRGLGGSKVEGRVMMAGVELYIARDSRHPA
jgi:hypothetical protein